jgi:hypothetical protein
MVTKKLLVETVVVHDEMTMEIAIGSLHGEYPLALSAL